MSYELTPVSIDFSHVSDSGILYCSSPTGIGMKAQVQLKTYGKGAADRKYGERYVSMTFKREDSVLLASCMSRLALNSSRVLPPLLLSSRSPSLTWVTKAKKHCSIDIVIESTLTSYDNVICTYSYAQEHFAECFGTGYKEYKTLDRIYRLIKGTLS